MEKKGLRAVKDLSTEDDLKDVLSAVFLLEGALFAIKGHSKRKDKDKQMTQITSALEILNKHGKHEKKKAGNR